MRRVGVVENRLALRYPCRSAAMVNVLGCQECDAAAAMIGVMPGYEPTTEVSRLCDVRKRRREIRMILHGLEVRFDVRVVV